MGKRKKNASGSPSLSPKGGTRKQRKQAARKVAKAMQKAAKENDDLLQKQNQQRKGKGRKAQLKALVERPPKKRKANHRVQDDGDDLPLPLFDDSAPAEANPGIISKSIGVLRTMYHAVGEAISPRKANHVVGGGATHQKISPEVSARLTKEAMRFKRLAAHSKEDNQAVKMAVQAVSEQATAVFGSAAETILFGSRAFGLALPGGDLDIGILNVDVQVQESSMKRKDRTKASTMLKKLLNRLRKTKLVRGKQNAQVIRARIPIIKCKITLDGQHSAAVRSFDCDISLGVSNGSRACSLLKEYIKQLPHFSTLVLSLKAVLLSHNLNEVYQGGLGSYSLYNMVIAHLLDCKKAQMGGDLGPLLVSFFYRFGYGFDYTKDAVSINHGGFIRKRNAWKNKDKPWLISIEDPQEDGRDIGGSSHNIQRVRKCFAQCFDALSCSDEDGQDNEWPLLSRIMNLSTALGRGGAGTQPQGGTASNQSKAVHQKQKLPPKRPPPRKQPAKKHSPKPKPKPEAKAKPKQQEWFTSKKRKKPGKPSRSPSLSPKHAGTKKRRKQGQGKQKQKARRVFEGLV